mmetsp:Transcript_16539/g.37185  ORF Transcript_16539/g.37185 Transcript_16539/m.37185 type:complete len:184 (-) Transcript_16539:34-585(-)
MGAAAAPPQAVEWPTWALKKQTLEVFVIDVAANHSAWVTATPIARVTDPHSGRDTHIAAEYVWNGEVFVEDFGPDRVRRVGGLYSVAEERVRNEDRDRLCMVCLDAHGDVLLVPCLHGNICATCADHILADRESARCPQCRTGIERYVSDQRSGLGSSFPVSSLSSCAGVRGGHDSWLGWLFN